MTTDPQPTPPEPDFESQITALLFGELSAAQAAHVRAAIASSPELQSLHDNLQATIGLVHEAVRQPVESEGSLPLIEHLHLSAQRRETLLKSLREAPIVQLPKTSSTTWRWAVPMGIAAGLVSMLGWFLLQQPTSSLIFAKQESPSNETRFGSSIPSQLFPFRARVLGETTIATNSSPWRDFDNDGSVDAFGLAAKTDPKTLDGPVRNTPTLGGVAPTEARGLERGEVLLQSSMQGDTQPPSPGAPPSSPEPALTLTPSAPVAGTTLNFFSESPSPPNSFAVTDAKVISDKNDLSTRRFGLWRKRENVSSGEPLNESLEARMRATTRSEESLVRREKLLSEVKQQAPIKLASPTPIEHGIAQEPQPTIDRLFALPDLGTERRYFDDSQSRGDALSGSLPAISALLSIAESRGSLQVENAPQDAVAPNRPKELPKPQPEIPTATQAYSTFSLNVTDVSFQLASVSLEKGSLPDPASIRIEEFLNAFQYRDPEPGPGVPVGFAWERAVSPFAHNREFLRFAIRTGARGRETARPLNLVLLLDNSGSMERADRVQLVRQALAIMSQQLKAEDRLSVVTFSRTPQLRLEAVPGNQIADLPARLGGLTPEGGTNLEEAMNLAYSTAARHFLTAGNNRVVLLTDGAANLGDVLPESLKTKVESWRQRGIALDCFGIGWEGLNDALLETLARHGDGRYGFLNSPEDTDTKFAAQLLGAFQVAASDVKVQVEFHPQRVSIWRQIGYARHQLTQQQFRDNTVDAAELAAAESGNALYVVQVNPNGSGPMATVRVRFRTPGTQHYREHAWTVPYTQAAPSLEQATPRMRLAACAASFGEWLVGTEFATEVTTDKLLSLLRDVPATFAPDPTPKRLESMIRQAKSVSGR